ncbi:MAG: ABC transporter ATP-binding protein [Sphaerochaetaceae bacterium]|nr:ABC transporter ATP-binding protein [Sphaerochaetaceae bacterium]
MKLEIRGVSKTFKEVKALDQVSLTFETGGIYGLLGRNGAGKSTLMNILTGRVVPDEGAITIDGEPVLEHDGQLSRLFMMGEENFYPEDMKVQQAFVWTGRFYDGFDLEKAQRLSKRFGLDVRQRIVKLSTGYKSIFKNIIALSLDVPFILLDEPVLGLDANHRDLFYKLLLQDFSEGNTPKAIIISTHLIEEIANLVENVAIIKDGRLLMQEAVETLLADACSVTGPAETVNSLTSMYKVLGSEQVGGTKTIYLAQRVDASQLPGGVVVDSVDLQKLFIELTNEESV